jgi:hypothetical protein
MCTGQQAFKGHDTISTLLAVATQEPPPVQQLNPEVPLALSELVTKLLAKDPAKRPQSAAEVIEAIQAIEAGQEQPTTVSRSALKKKSALEKPHKPAAQARAKARASTGIDRRWWFLGGGAAAALLLLVLILVIVNLFGGSESNPAPAPPPEEPGRPADGTPLAPSKPADIAWLLEAGAVVTLRTGPGTEITLKPGQPLPAGPATIVGVHLADKATDDEVMARLATLTDLESVVFYADKPGNLTATGLGRLRTLAKMKQFNLASITQDAASAVEVLDAFPRLESLRLPVANTDAWAERAARVPTLTDVSAYRTNLTDQGLAHLAKLPRLQALNLVDSRMTPEAIQQFAKQVPWCRIVWGPGANKKTIEPTAPPPGSP